MKEKNKTENELKDLDCEIIQGKQNAIQDGTEVQRGHEPMYDKVPVTDREKILQTVMIEKQEVPKNTSKQQEVTFSEEFERRLQKLETRQAELEDLPQHIASEIAKLNIKESELLRRELAITEHEIHLDPDISNKASSLIEEAKRQHKANVQEASQLKEREEILLQAQAKLEKDKEALRQREQKIAEAENKRDAGFADAHKKLDKELDEKRSIWEQEKIKELEILHHEIKTRKEKSLSDLEQEISSIREKRLTEITLTEEKERTRIRQATEEETNYLREKIAKERKEWDAEREAQQAALKTYNQNNEKKDGELSLKEDHLLAKETELQAQERDLENRTAQIEKFIEDRIADRKKSFEEEKSTQEEEIERLRNSLKIQTTLLNAFEDLKRQLGDKDPAEVLRDLNEKTDIIKQLREDLANRPTEEMRERYADLENKRQREKERADQLEEQLEKNEAAVAETADLKRKNNELEAQNRSLTREKELWEASSNEAHAKLKRLRNAYERPAEVKARYEEIEMPYIQSERVNGPVHKTSDIDELTWLKGISQACDNYGLHFPDRILKSFHTAIKTAEWSPLTILAGVSGTGKSELPRLYSHFGGILFESLSVQPNWDSQESMLGFFNSIDNKFDAQPVLRFLAQSQKPWEVDENGKLYPGLNEAVCMVLLDEMNLAHPELYFAEFLSKLESRRGMSGKNVPCLPVKIGAGMKPYQLPLGRNVFWTGTMNQDETTKSLSDKVLDRSIVIHFPRPIELKRRQKLIALDEKNRSPFLHKDNFFHWFAKKSTFEEKQIKPYKKFVEEINESLTVAGRAIGHRVWQSIEYYMVNYPDVRAVLDQGGDDHALRNAMHTAFEDQLVQKVMPKLRGINTRGKTRTDCLEKILGQINRGIPGINEPFNLENDFNLACELGYGQFIWQSANYLNEEKKVTFPKPEVNSSSQKEKQK